MLIFGPTALTRRRLLTGVVSVPLVLSAGACTDDAPVDSPPDPDREALEAAYEVETAAIAALEGWPARAGDVTQAEVRSALLAHISALTTALATAPPTTASTSALPTPSESPAGSDSDPQAFTTAQAVAVLDAAAADHTRALRTATPTTSPLLASIAASDAALAAAVRRDT